jgi:hypothetical protein
MISRANSTSERLVLTAQTSVNTDWSGVVLLREHRGIGAQNPLAVIRAGSNPTLGTNHINDLGKVGLDQFGTATR